MDYCFKKENIDQVYIISHNLQSNTAYACGYLLGTEAINQGLQ